MFDSTLTTQEKEIIDGCMEVVMTNPELDLCRIIAKLNMQIESLRAQLSYDNDNNPCKDIEVPYIDYRSLEPEDHKEYTAKKNVSKTPLAKKVITKYGN